MPRPKRHQGDKGGGLVGGEGQQVRRGRCAEGSRRGVTGQGGFAPVRLVVG